MSVDEHWRKAFLTIKGALDFIGVMDDVEVTITDGAQDMRLVVTSREAKRAAYRE